MIDGGIDFDMAGRVPVHASITSIERYTARHPQRKHRGKLLRRKAANANHLSYRPARQDALQAAGPASVS